MTDSHPSPLRALATLLTATLAVAACADQGNPGPSGPAGPKAPGLVRAAATVPDEHATIQAAIDAAADLDVITVAAGTYLEDLTITKDVTLRGAGRGVTTIFGELLVDDLSDVTIEALTLDGLLNDDLTSAGVTAFDSALTLARVEIRGYSVGVSIVDLDAFDEGPHRIRDTIISNNGLYGVELFGVRTAVIENTIVSYNGGHGFYVAADIGHDPADVTFANCLAFANGFSLSGGAGIRIGEDDNVLVVNTIAVSNAVGLSCPSGCVNDHNLVWGNYTNYAGASPGDNNVTRDPRFTAPSEGDFTLRFDSPAIDAGANGVGPNTDIAGKPRPIGAATDIGPHEHGTPTAAVTVVINEVMANPIDEATGEYIELHNHGTTAVDVAGWIIDDGDATDSLTGFDGGPTSIPAGGYGVILDPGYPGGTYSIPSGAVRLTITSTAAIGSGLSNNDPVRLFIADGTTQVDSYSFPFDAGNGTSVERDNVADGDTGANWLASPCGKSPGAENCASQPVNVGGQILIAINEIMANPADESTGEFIELYNFGSGPVDLAGMLLDDGDATDALASFSGGSTTLQAGQYAVVLDPDYSGGYTIPAGALLLTADSTATLGNGLATTDPITLRTANGQSVIDSYSTPFNPGDSTSVEKINALLIDVPSNFTTSTCASGSSPGAPNCVTQGGTTPTVTVDLFITEVMANPLDEDTGEFIEIFNFSDAPVDLAGYRISDGDAEERLEAFSSGGSTVVPSLGYAVILDAEYAGQHNIPSAAVRLRTDDTTIGSGLSTNDPITLRAPSGARVIASYSFPLNPGNGVSVERADLFLGDVAQNWVASPCGASPGADNCASGGSPPVTAPVATTSVVISEVMANPLDESQAEFVELFNAGPIGVDVAGWRISDGGATDVIEAFASGGNTVIPPGGIAVILDPDYNNNYVIGAGTVRLKVGNSTIGNGLTTTDAITLTRTDDAVADTFSFPTNPGNGRSTEKVTLTAGDVAANWVASTCAAKTDSGAANGPYFASPGRRNCADPYGGESGINTLGQRCPFGAADCLSGLCAIDLSDFGTFCTEDCSTSACPAGFECTAISDVNYPEICVPTGGGATPEVRINELLYDAVGADTEVFIELTGAPGTILDGITLVGVNGANGGDYVSLSLTGQIPANGYFVVAHPSATGAIAANADMTSSKVDFQNGPDSVQVRYGDVVLDALAYGDFSAAIFAGEWEAAASVTPGVSLARLPDGADTGDNSVDFDGANATPGAANAQ